MKGLIETYFTALTVALLYVFHISEALLLSPNVVKHRYVTKFHAKKHLASAGIFPDQLQRNKDEKLKKLYKDIVPKIEPSELKTEKVVTGSELRSNRNRDLKEVKRELDAIAAMTLPLNPTIEPRRKRTDDDVDMIVDALNKMLKSKTKLTEEERLGVIDLVEFKQVASAHIPNYENDPKVSKSIHSWISYHRRKKELRIVSDDLGKSYFWEFERAKGGLAGNTEKKARAQLEKASKSAAKFATEGLKISEKELQKLKNII